MLVPQDAITRAEDILERHLASYGREGSSGGGIKLIGGRKWWTVRGKELEGEWIEVSHPTGLGHVADAVSGAKLTRQMQKDYLRRTATRPSTATEPSSPIEGVVTASHRHSFLPRRQATLGSVKDNSGHEVIGDRVILYIHGKSHYDFISAHSLAAHSSSLHSTPIDIRFNGMLGKPEQGRSVPLIACPLNTLS